MATDRKLLLCSVHELFLREESELFMVIRAVVEDSLSEGAHIELRVGVVCSIFFCRCDHLEGG